MRTDRMNTALTDYVTTDQTLRQEKPEQFHRDFYRRPAIWAAVILLLLLIVINQFTGNLNARLGREKGFTEYVFIKMIEYQDEFVQEEWPDLFDDSDLGEWTILESDSTTRLSEQQVARQLLGEGVVVWGWRDLQAHEGEVLWNAWSASDRETPPDVFIEEQLQQQIQEKTLPYLKHNTWLVTDAQGVQYILCEREAWGVCPMTAVTAAALAHE